MSYLSTQQMVGREVPSHFDGVEALEGPFSIRYMKNVIAKKPQLILAFNGLFLGGTQQEHGGREALKSIAKVLIENLGGVQAFEDPLTRLAVILYFRDFKE